MSAIDVTAGGSVSYAGEVNLPAGQWTATCKCVDGKGRVYEFEATLTADGPAVAGQYPHAIVIEAASDETASWAEPGERLKTAEGSIRFADASNPPVVIWSARFSVQIKGAPFA